MIKLKLEGKQTDIIRKFIEVDRKELYDKAYKEIKITMDKQGNIIKQSEIDNNRSKYSHDKYVYKLKRQGYIEVN